MDLISADSNMQDLEFIEDYSADIEIGKSDNSFDISIPSSNFNSNFQAGNVLYFPGTEFGGIIGEIKSETSADTIHLIGYTWRGMLSKKIIEPDSGTTEKSVSGDLNVILSQIIGDKFNQKIRVSTELSGTSLENYKIIGYSTMLEAFNLMLQSVNFKLKISYKQLSGTESYVEISAVPIEDYSNEIELSSDYQLNFTFDSVLNGVNHLILINPETNEKLDIYADENGNIVDTAFYTGLKEIEEKFESSESDQDSFKQAGIDHFKEVMNRKTFSMDVESLNLDVDIGDIIGGRDYISGLYIKKPIISKVLKIEDGKTSLEYEIEGEGEN